MSSLWQCSSAYGQEGLLSVSPGQHKNTKMCLESKKSEYNHSTPVAAKTAIVLFVGRLRDTGPYCIACFQLIASVGKVLKCFVYL